MSSKFDIEAAKRGEPVEHKRGGEWFPTHFVGLSKNGHPVIDKDGYGTIAVPATDLRMAPKKIKVRWREAVLRNEKGVFISTCNEHQGPVPAIYESWDSFVQWIHTDWQEAEIEQ